MLVTMLIVLSACSSERRELTRIASPDHATTAIVIQELGGGATVSATYLLYFSDENGELSGPRLTATYCGGLSLAWKGGGTLLMEYDSECYIRQFINKWWSKSAIKDARPATVEIELIRRPDGELRRQ
jgi:hypothetical protein